MKRIARLALVPLAALGASGCLNVQLRSEVEPLVETVVQGEEGPKILLLEIDGPLSEQAPEASLFGASEVSTVARVREILDRAREDDEIRAVVLRINSPGGSVTASDLVHGELARFRAERGVPVVAYLLGLAVSGGYYVAMAADEVVAHPTAVTGSIGVIFFGLNVSGLMEKLGIADQTFTAGAYKDMGSPLRPMRPGEPERLQAVLDGLHARFKGAVLGGRGGLDPARVDALADGSIYGAQQALELGLVDAIADFPAAIERVEARLGTESSRVVSYHRPRAWKQNVYGRPLVPPTVRLELAPSLAGHVLPPGFYYLWAPALR